VNYFNYFTEIEDTFIRRRGKHLFLSPLDWALIDAWKERGIPLHIVIRSIESVFDIFDRQPPGTRTIKSLFYCREEVEVQYAEWLRAHAGKDDEASEPADSGLTPGSIRQHISDSIAKLRELDSRKMGDGGQRAVARLETLLAEMTDEQEATDATLADIERMLEHSMLENWDKEHLKAIEKEIASQLREYKSSMTAEEYKNTFGLMLIKRLREEAGVPRLGLLYL
jgi:molybdopterin converting factor small subunit